jgi:hypothetical protein
MHRMEAYPEDIILQSLARRLGFDPDLAVTHKLNRWNSGISRKAWNSGVSDTIEKILATV